jgi:hypothetical protein
MSWYRVPLVGLATRYYFLSECCCLNFAALYLLGALSDERTNASHRNYIKSPRRVTVTAFYFSSEFVCVPVATRHFLLCHLESGVVLFPSNFGPFLLQHAALLSVLICRSPVLPLAVTASAATVFTQLCVYELKVTGGGEGEFRLSQYFLLDVSVVRPLISDAYISA